MSLPPLSLYIHIPWCVQKCPYCDFNSHAQKQEIPETRYIDALIEDLTTDLDRYSLTHSSRKLHSIFIGGGTPSLISPTEIGRLLKTIAKHIAFEEEIEITLEANPGTIEAERFAEYQNQGINRISIGIQSFDDEKLQQLGRIHNAQEAIHAAQLTHQLPFNSFNLDIMHGLPNQTPEQALTDLDTAIALHPKHISWYQLTIEPNTLFYSKPPQLPNEESLWQIYQQGHKRLQQAGYQQYEISGYSQDGYQCQHNLNYWHFGDYLGIGCGAHGKLTFDDGRILRTTKVKHPKGYLSAHQNLLNTYLASETEVEEKERPFEFFMNRFRLLEPCPKSAFIERTHLSFKTIEQPIHTAIQQGLLTDNETHWQVTEKGQLFFNDLIALFVDD